MTRRHLIVSGLGMVLLTAALWYIQSERRLRRTWHELVDTVEARHARALGQLLADDYGDRWGYTRTTLVTDARLAFRHFESLEIRIEDEQVRLDGDRGTVTAHLRVEARGTARATEARVAANALFSPFIFEWRRADRFPWEWQLVRFDQPEFDLGRFRREMAGGY